MSTPKNKKQPISPVKPAVMPDVEVAAHVTDPSVTLLKEETLRWIFSIIGSLSVYVIIAKIIQSVYHPDIKPLIDEANRITYAGDSRPEPVEGLLFRVGLLTFIFGIMALYFIFSKTSIIKKLAETPFFLFITSLCVVFVCAMIYLDLTAQNPFFNGGGDQPQHSRDFVGKTNFDFFFQGIFLGSNLLLYTFFLVPAIACIFYLGIKKYHWDTKKLFNTVSSTTGYVVIGATVLAIFFMNVFDFPYSFENKYDFNAVYYSMTQVYAGVPMLVNGFSNTYGLYPHFLNLIFHFTGLSVYSFSFMMALLVSSAYAFNFFSLKQFVNNKVILLLGAATVIFFPFLDFKFVNNFDCLFAFFSIRYIIPSTLLFLTCLYVRKRSQLIYWLTFALMGFFILWNPEIGMVSYLSWVAFNIYNDFYNKEGKPDIKRILFHPVIGTGVVIAVLFVYKYLIYAFYHEWVDFKLLFGFIAIFGSLGIGNLPMVLVHPWNITALVIILGITYSIVKWYNKDITPKASIVFLVTLISIGFFIYFQGRSHNWPYATSTGFSFILLTILGDELWEKIKNTGLWSLHALFVVFLFIISFSFFEIITDTQKFNEVVYQEDDKTKQQEEETRLRSNEGFIVKNSKEGEKIHVISVRNYPGYYFDGNKRKSAFNPGIQDIIFNSDLVRMANLIRDSSFSVFIEPGFCQHLFMSRPLAAVAATYQFKAANNTMEMLEKRKLKVPSRSVLNHPDNLVIHKKYTDDTAGINARINDAQGIDPVTLSTEFSVEVVFNPQTQIYQYATLVGNMNDSSGFVIGNIINTQNYFFGVNGKGVSLPGEQTKWVYFVLNVYRDHYEVFQNGKPAGAFPLAVPIRQSNLRLYIGGLGFGRYYLGAISEVEINNKVLDKAQVQATWEDISKL